MRLSPGVTRVKIHEYQAKDILRRYGIPVSPGKVASTPEEAEPGLVTSNP
jgi:succinyl-CoA synthetase beta subunit